MMASRHGSNQKKQFNGILLEETIGATPSAWDGTVLTDDATVEIDASTGKTDMPSPINSSCLKFFK